MHSHQRNTYTKILCSSWIQLFSLHPAIILGLSVPDYYICDAQSMTSGTEAKLQVRVDPAFSYLEGRPCTFLSRSGGVREIKGWRYEERVTGCLYYVSSAKRTLFAALLEAEPLPQELQLDLNTHLWLCCLLHSHGTTETAAGSDNIYVAATGEFDELCIDIFQDRWANRNNARACDVPETTS